MSADPALTGGGLLLRVTWVPGSDELRGECHCGAVRTAQDPVDVWAWLLEHQHRTSS